LAFQRPTEGGLTIESDVEGTVLVLRLDGELTLLTQGQFVERQHEALSKDFAGVVVDVSGMSFMDSSGLGAIIVFQRKAREAGVAVAFGGFTELPRRVLEVTHMDLVMDLHDTASEALAAVNSSVRERR
jgi:anti-sigma B factor antagonist